MGNLRVLDQGARFTSLQQAEADGRQISQDPRADAVIIRAPDNSYWVYKIDELVRVAGTPAGDAATLSRITGLTLPTGATLHAFVASQDGAATAPRADPVDVQLTALSLRNLPEYRERVRQALTSAIRQLRNAENTLARTRRPSDNVREVREDLQRQLTAIDAGRWGEAATAAAALPSVMENALGREPAGYGHDVMQRVQGRTIDAVRPPSRAANVPPEVANTAERLTLAYKEQSELVLNAIYADTYAEFIDTVGNTGRIRPDDDASAVLRLNTCLYTVQRDLQLGRLTPADFGKATWDAVDARAIYDLAIKRLHDDSVDFSVEIPAMLADPVWANDPVHIQDPKNGVIELKPDNIGWFRRSIYSSLAPNEAAESIEELAFARSMRDGAVAAASASSTDREQALAQANFDTAWTLYKGNGIAANASQAVLAMSGLTGVSIATAEIADVGTTRADLERMQREGAIAAFTPIGDSFIVYKLKPLATLAREVRDKLSRGELNDLGATTRARLMELTGPSDEPGALLSDRLESEASSRKWRQVGSEVVQVVAITVASMGVGALVEGVAVGARATYGVIRAARFVVTTATFTTLSGVAQGDLDPARYPIDAAMFGLLGAAGRFAGIAGKLIPGRSATALFLQKAAAHTVAVGSSATLLTGFSALEQTVRGRTPTWKQTVEQFGVNLATVATLHAVNLGVARIRPELAPGSSIRSELQRLEAELQRANADMTKTLGDMALKLRQGQQATSPAEIERIAGEYEALMQRFNAQSSAAGRLKTDLADFARRSLPAALAAEILAVLEGGPVAATPPAFEVIRFELREVSASYQGEETGVVWGTKVKYLTAEERPQYEVRPRDGSLVGPDGRPYSTEGAHSAHTGAGRAIFVLSADGKLYLALHQEVGKFHHSSLAAGQPVAAAGEMVIRNGKLLAISDRSGHYRPEPRHIVQLIRHLQRSGVDLSQTKIESWSGRSMTVAEYLATHGGGK